VSQWQHEKLENTSMLLYPDVDTASHQQGLETHMVYGRPYFMQMQTRVPSTGWKLVWFMADPTLCRCRHESPARVGKSYDVWQTLL